jgi:hypothetical protein
MGITVVEKNRGDVKKLIESLKDALLEAKAN